MLLVTADCKVYGFKSSTWSHVLGAGAVNSPSSG